MSLSFQIMVFRRVSTTRHVEFKPDVSVKKCSTKELNTKDSTKPGKLLVDGNGHKHRSAKPFKSTVNVLVCIPSSKNLDRSVGVRLRKTEFELTSNTVSFPPGQKPNKPEP